MALNVITNDLVSQAVLYAECHSHWKYDSNWFTSPEGLEWTMRHRDPGGSNNFQIVQSTDAEIITRRIMWSIYKDGMAPMAVVNGGEHWLVVRGFSSSSAPTGPSDMSCRIETIDVANPTEVPNLPGLPPPHTSADGCGTGVIPTSTNLTRGNASYNMAYARWKESFLLPAVLPGYWQGKIVAVVSDKSASSPQTGVQSLANLTASIPILSPQKAKMAADKSLVDFGLNLRPEYAAVSKSAVAVNPLLVQRLDRSDSFYYIIPYQDKNAPGVVSKVISVNASGGAYYESAVRRLNTKEGVFSAISREAALKIGMSQTNFNPQMTRKEAIGIHPNLVWKPCRESFSPFVPFYLLTIGEHLLYVRVDGVAFTELHTHDQGR
jgi:hypothetical protein